MKKQRSKAHQCPNCGFDFKIDPHHNNFCPNCGQENHNPRQPFFHYCYELLEGILHFDSKIWFTLYTLIFKPGTITKDCIENKRARYTPPVRMLFFTLLIFVVTLEWAQHEMIAHQSGKPDLSLGELVNREHDSAMIAFSDPFFTGGKIYYSVSQLKELRKLPREGIVSWLRTHKLPTDIIHRLQYKYIQRNILSAFSVEAFQQRVTKLHYWLILVMMPISAIFIYLIFYKKELLYFDTLTLATHFYIFSQLSGSLLALLAVLFINLGWLKDTGLILGADLFLALVLNMLPAYKKVFGLSWLSTLVRAILVNGVHFFFYILTFWLFAGNGIF